MKAFEIRPELGNLVPSATLLINERSRQLQEEGRKVYRLGFGQSPFPVPEPVVKELCHFASEKDYLPVQGLKKLRETVADYYQRVHGLSFGPEQITIGPGSKELILGIQMVCDADILLPNPSWVSYEPQSQIVGAGLSWIDTKENENWLITGESLDLACQKDPERRKILILNYPSNPVGCTLDQGRLMSIANVARKHNILIVADEIYGDLTFADQHRSIARYYPEGTVISGGLSKWCGAGGWRLGTFCFPKQLQNVQKAMLALASESFSAVSAPVQYAAVEAFSGNPEIEDYLSASKTILRGVSEYVHLRLTDMKISMPKAHGGFYLFPNFEHYRASLENRGINTSIDLCEALLMEKGIALLPGSAFGRPGKEYTCRLSYVDFDGKAMLEGLMKGEINSKDIPERCPSITGAMNELSDWLKKLNS